MERRTGDKIEINGDYQYNAFYTGKAPQRFWHFTKITEAIKSLQLKKGDNVLDVGCGSGLVSFFMAKDNEVNVTAIDANDSALAFANQKFVLPNLQFKKGLLDELNLKKGSYQKIIFLEVIEHISEKQGEQIFKSFYELLSPGGRLVISTPNRYSLWPLIEWSLDFFKVVPNLAEEQHEFLYTGKLLKQKGINAGFILADKRSINTFSPWAALLSWKLAIGIHKLEFMVNRNFGSILLYTFEKK